MSAPHSPDPSRQAPLYGEYATPEEVAALLGTAAPATAPATPAPTTPAARSTPHPPLRPEYTGARRFDRPVTIGLLAFGFFSLFQFAPILLDFAYALEQITAGGPMADARWGELTDVAGRALFGALLVLLVAAIVFSIMALRAGRVAFWIPLTAGIAGGVAMVVVYVVILTQTPGALPSVT